MSMYFTSDLISHSKRLGCVNQLQMLRSGPSCREMDHSKIIHTLLWDRWSRSALGED